MRFRAKNRAALLVIITLIAVGSIAWPAAVVKAQRLDSVNSPVSASIAKLGFMKSNLYFGNLTLGFERKIKESWSAQVDLGVLPFNPGGKRYASFFGLFLGAEGRYYFALRRNPLSGFYVGPHLGFNYNIYNRYQLLPIKKSVAYWGQFGLSIGFQQRLFEHLSVGVGAKGGYSGTLYSRYYRTDGSIGAKYTDPQLLSISLCLTAGYQF